MAMKHSFNSGINDWLEKQTDREASGSWVQITTYAENNVQQTASYGFTPFVK